MHRLVPDDDTLGHHQVRSDAHEHAGVEHPPPGVVVEPLDCDDDTRGVTQVVMMTRSLAAVVEARSRVAPIEQPEGMGVG